MSLSNTATPKYYGQFREAVINGEIPVCEKISMEMNRIDDLIADPKYYYDESAVEGYIRFCEGELTLVDGSELKLLDTFKLWAEEVYGWYYFEVKQVYRPYKNKHGGRYVKRTVKKRLTNKQYLIVARGAAKTLYDETHQAYFLVMDTSTTQQATCAPTIRQAEEVLSPFRTAITRAIGPLFKFLTSGSIHNTTGNRADRQMLVSTKKGIENFLTNSSLETVPMMITKAQGRRDKCVTIDEWLSCDIREDVVGAFEQGASKIEGYLIIASSSEGTVRNGTGDSIKMELMDILNGVYYAPNVSIWWYCLDDVKEVSDPEMWIKANPNIGITVGYDVYERDVERCENVPSSRNDILAKRFGIPMAGFTYFFTYAETLPHPKKNYWRMTCALGADLSQGDDFCAFTFLFPLRDGLFGVKTRSYITEKTLMNLQPAMREKYNDFIREGTLVIMDGTILDMMEVYEDLDQEILDKQYDVRAFGYDPYGAKEFVERWCQDNGEYCVNKIIQGAKTESIPLGELKKMAHDRMLLFDEELMEFAMGNCIVLEDTNGNRKLFKKRSEEKIDNVAAMMDAFIAWKSNRDAFE